MAFCGWLDATEGSKHRLPTEAEWEYACRAGTSTLFGRTGENPDDPARLLSYANLADQSLQRMAPQIGWVVRWDDGFPFTSPVGTFSNNDLELVDMLGNAWEWCQDKYDSEFYRKSPSRDPVNLAGNGARVFRGGGFDNWTGFLRCADRYSSHSPKLRTEWAGFRLVREIPQ